MSKLYYSFPLYCANNVVLIISIIFIVRCLFGVLFQVQTYVNSEREMEVSPVGTRKFFKILSLCMVVGLLILLMRLYVPIVLYTPRILAGVSLGVRGEVLSNYRGQIALFWILCVLMLIFIVGKKLLFALTKRVKISRKKTEIFVWSKKYTVLLLFQSFFLTQSILILIGALCGQYNVIIQLLWSIGVYVELLLIIISSICEYQKIILFRNGLIIYFKGKKEGCAQRKEMEITITDKEEIQICIKGIVLFEEKCSAEIKKELAEIM